MQNISIVTLKAFGDFVIACSAIKRFRSPIFQKQLGIIAGSHLKNIAVALGTTQNVQFLGGYVYPKIPPAFNFKESGILESVKDLFFIRSQIARVNANTFLVFDQAGPREIFIAFGKKSVYLPKDVPNIYLAYDKLFTSIGIPFECLPESPKKKVRKVLIIPGARMQFRNIPKDVISRVSTVLKDRDIEFRVISIAGEELDLPPNSNVTVLPRDFAALISSIKSADLILSADSLSAHLSFYFDVPVFVFTPIPDWTMRWLPVSAYSSKAIASFSDEKAFENWLDAR
jgi:ADP-heptose:LPS heptosyltransferase